MLEKVLWCDTGAPVPNRMITPQENIKAILDGLNFNPSWGTSAIIFDEADYLTSKQINFLLERMQYITYSHGVFPPPYTGVS